MRTLALLLMLCVSCASADRDAFESHVFRSSANVTLPYRLLRPAGRGPHPLVVLFHGSGAIGNDNRSQIGAVARSWATDDARGRYPAFVLVPQFPARSSNYSPYAQGTELLRAALELVHHIRETENVDAKRVYAMGFSMGGSAIWNALEWEPGLFARAAIVAGVPTADLPNLDQTALLLVHGDQDVENPFTLAWNAHLRAPDRIEFWRYPGLAHEFPQELIDSDRLRDWLFR